MSKIVERISDLCPAQRALVEEMQRIRYGTIEWLAIRDGLPEFVADTLCLPAYQIVGSNGPHPASDRDDTALKPESWICWSGSARSVTAWCASSRSSMACPPALSSKNGPAAGHPLPSVHFLRPSVRQLARRR